MPQLGIRLPYLFGRRRFAGLVLGLPRLFTLSFAAMKIIGLLLCHVRQP